MEMFSQDKATVEKIFSFASRLQATTKKKEKEKIIEEAKYDEQKEYFMKFILDPKIITGISKAKISKNLSKQIEYFVSTFFDMCNFLAMNHTGTDEDIAVVQKYINDNDDKYKNFLIAAFTKNLPLGVEAKTVNKILGKTLIDDWQVQQAYLIDKYPLKPNTWFSVSQKLNGCHCSFYKGEMISRQGTEFAGLSHIVNEINTVLGCEFDWFLDGELIRKNVDGKSDSENFQITAGLANSKDSDKTDLEFVIYDILPTSEFDNGQSSLSYSQRLKSLLNLSVAIQTNHCQYVRIVPIFYSGYDQTEINKWLDYAVENDYEGVMLNLDTPYYCKRHRGILKVKRFYTMDLPIIAIEEGQNRLAGTLGALVVDFKGNQVRVGSGFDDDLRSSVWGDKDRYIGQLAEVKYKSITKDKRTGKESLQFPVFQRFRFDKNEVSYD